MTAAARQYELRIAPRACQVIRSGPGDIAQLGVGRSISEVIRLAGLLFPICPRAHMAAALAAVEHANQIQLGEGQKAARDCVVLAEAVVSAIWRTALSWPSLVKEAAIPGAVKRARKASDDIATALYEYEWSHIGGAPMAINSIALQDAFAALRRVLTELQPISESVIAESCRVPCGSLASQPLADALFKMDLDPLTACFEETPRLLHGLEDGAETLMEWFSAHARHVDGLMDALEGAAQRLEVENPAPLPDQLNGSGIGVFMTARGRLRHGITLENGIVQRWTIAAPTDWNFAPKGPLPLFAEQVLALSDIPKRDMTWLVAAFDPCAPCTLTWGAANDA
ncbi:MAG: nickel-dependent hydrogenase large subunit [Pseudomonadota bacterium]